VPISFNGLGSIDPGSDPLTYGWDFGDGTSGIGPAPSHAYAAQRVYSLVLTVSDGVISDAETSTVAIGTTNLAPTVTCPPAGTVECGDTAHVTAQVSDPGGDPLQVIWTLNGAGIQTNLLSASAPGAVTNIDLSGSFPLGTNILGVSVSDGVKEASCSTTVTVVDTAPPVIKSVVAWPNVLWPPNHKMVRVNLRASVRDTCSPTTWKIIGVQSNEPVNGRGDGHTSADWKIVGAHAVDLRAERSGNGPGRIYSITVQATDHSGNVSEPSNVLVRVPKSMGKK
jgi:PKD repeat protein